MLSPNRSKKQHFQKALQISKKYTSFPSHWTNLYPQTLVFWRVQQSSDVAMAPAGCVYEYLLTDPEDDWCHDCKTRFPTVWVTGMSEVETLFGNSFAFFKQLIMRAHPNAFGQTNKTSNKKVRKILFTVQYLKFLCFFFFFQNPSFISIQSVYLHGRLQIQNYFTVKN